MVVTILLEFGKALAWSCGAEAHVQPWRDCALGGGAFEVGADVHLECVCC